jgi:curved DNA-binding protein CbpA
MNGQLREQPLAELIREISAKSIGGRLQLQHERLRAVIYFDKGDLLYAASNLRQLRLREYLLKAGINEAALARYDERQPDLELAGVLTRDHVLSPATAEQIQTRQASDVLRLALSWTEGLWEFDQKARLSETLNFKLDARPLLLEAGRRTPPKFVASRFRVPSELISPGAALTGSEDLLPTEVFLLSRLDRPTPLNEVIAVSGLSENETLVLVYSLSLTGLLQREHWKNALGSRMAVTEPEPEKPTAPEPALEEQSAEEEVDVESFLARINNAQTHYEVLDVSNEASPAHMKTKYYDLARRYHPDRFRKEDASLVARMESAFARITQAYDTLRDDGLRASYDAKLRARQKAQQLADAAPKPAATPVTPTSAKPETSVKDAAASLAERAEKQFKEGFAALELGERKAALGLFASAATAVPNEARYRAFYGQLLAEQEHTRRAAETELQAAVKLDPKNGEYRVILAALYRDLGLMLRARGEAERALEADPNNRRARDLLRALKSV